MKCISPEVLLYSGLKIVSMYNLIDVCIKLTITWFTYLFSKMPTASRGVFFVYFTYYTFSVDFHSYC